jgi:hypothetical protein
MPGPAARETGKTITWFAYPHGGAPAAKALLPSLRFDTAFSGERRHQRRVRWLARGEAAESAASADEVDDRPCLANGAGSGRLNAT